ncbi:MAG: hypothetical protein R3F39_00120 [Myxococcota bacterium]
MTTPPPLPAWLVATAPAGSLRVRWSAPPEPPEPPTQASLLVCLRPIFPDDAEEFWAGGLDSDIIRHPVSAGDGHATLAVPSGRELHLALVLRGPDGALMDAPALSLAPEPSLAPAPPRVLEAPVHHDHGASDPPALIFVAGTAAPDLDALARRVALAVGASSPAPSAPASVPAFAARPRWSLVRLAFEPPPGAPLRLIRRDRAIEAAELAGWRDRPPPDALELPPDTDALIDGLADPAAPEPSVMFYAVFAGPAPWTPLPVVPLLPPFDAARRPALLGDVEARLAPAVDQRLARLATAPVALGDLPLELALIEAAVRCLPDESALKLRVAARVAHHRTAQRY